MKKFDKYNEYAKSINEKSSKELLSKVDLTIYIVGKQGSGKTTLANKLVGLLTMMKKEGVYVAITDDGETKFRNYLSPVKLSKFLKMKDEDFKNREFPTAHIITVQEDSKGNTFYQAIERKYLKKKEK